ncbi:MAG TPA: hypothetical protein DDZ40_01270 [Deltaproteobacteria bacterium]|nr:hypothetical protein [Deltaproteobacteria bacterium]
MKRGFFLQSQRFRSLEDNLSLFDRILTRFDLLCLLITKVNLFLRVADYHAPPYATFVIDFPSVPPPTTAVVIPAQAGDQERLWIRNHHTKGHPTVLSKHRIGALYTYASCCMRGLAEG